jgi:aryl-alcohol dehydrogenase-like predicted oxidoreductase
MSRIGLGTAQLAFKDITPEQGIATIHAALDSGIRLIDTALAYTRVGVESYAEDLVRRALRDRDGVLVATKGGHYRDGDTFPVDASPAALRANCETSLRALGKIASIGLSNVSVAQIIEARAEAPIATVQNRLSMAEPADRPTAAYCGAEGLRYLAYLPLGGPGSRLDTPEVTAAASQAGVSAARIRLGWVLAQGPHVTALVGASRAATISDSASAVPLPHLVPS